MIQLPVKKIQDEIIEAYQIDFHKYTKQYQIPHVTKVFETIPALLGKKFIYSHIDNNVRIEAIKNAVQLLETAGIAMCWLSHVCTTTAFRCLKK